MHIVFLSARYPPDVRGGGEISTQILAEALVDAGERVTVFCGDERTREENVNGVRVQRLRQLNPWRGKPLVEEPVSRGLAGVLERILEALSPRPDVIHAHEFRSALTLAVLRHRARIATIRDFAPICGTTNNMWWDGSSCTGCFWPNVLFRCHRVAEASLVRKPFRVWQYKGNLGFRVRSFRALPTLVYTSRVLQDRVEERLHPPSEGRPLKTPRRQSIVIPNAVDPIWLTEQPTPPPQKLTLCAVGRLESTKGTDILLAAFAEVRKEIPDAHLHLVGGGEIPRYVSRARELGVTRAVTFHGPIAPALVRSLVSGSTAVVSAHLWEEPFGRSALEAGASGRPLVASDLGGVRETTTRDTALLVPPGNVEVLASALVALAHEPERARRIGVAARQRVEEHFHPRTIAQRHQELYRVSVRDDGSF